MTNAGQSLSCRCVAPLLALALAGAAAVAGAQAYPTKVIRIVTAGVGGGNDLVSRLIAAGIAGPLGQPVIVENRGGGFAAGEAAYRAAPDGYTLLVMSGGLWIGPLVRRNVPYTVLRDFIPITLADRAPNILVVHPSLPVKTVRELIAFAKAHPGMLNYSSAGTASSSQLSGELFKAMAGVDMVNIQYKNNSQEIVDLLSGNMHLAFGTASAVMPHIRDRKLRALAVTGAQPSPLAPGLATIAASGLPGYESESYHAVFAPARTPAAIVTRLNHEIVKLLKSAEVKERLFQSGVESVGGSQEELRALIQAEVARWSKVIREAGIKG
jgi:tripartite-type tricarboxylate transporter receptor subunit TctC